VYDPVNAVWSTLPPFNADHEYIVAVVFPLGIKDPNTTVFTTVTIGGEKTSNSDSSVVGTGIFVLIGVGILFLLLIIVLILARRRKNKKETQPDFAATKTAGTIHSLKVQKIIDNAPHKTSTMTGSTVSSERKKPSLFDLLTNIKTSRFSSLSMKGKSRGDIPFEWDTDQEFVPGAVSVDKYDIKNKPRPGDYEEIFSGLNDGAKRNKFNPIFDAIPDNDDNNVNFVDEPSHVVVIDNPEPNQGNKKFFNQKARATSYLDVLSEEN
jgi:hypothetical protein